MSESEKIERAIGGSKRRRVTLTIRRDDHIGDRIGTLFLEPLAEGENGAIRRVREYLGTGINIVKVEVGQTQLDADVECTAWIEESNRLSKAAEDLSAKGARRNASEMLKEALRLDPLNRGAIVSLGLVLEERGQDDEALKTLRRAREIAGDRVDILKALAQVCVRLDRTATAISYLERALELEPKNEPVRNALAALGRAPAPLTRQVRHVSVIQGGRK